MVFIYSRDRFYKGSYLFCNSPSGFFKTALKQRAEVGLGLVKCFMSRFKNLPVKVSGTNMYSTLGELTNCICKILRSYTNEAIGLYFSLQKYLKNR